MGIDGCAESLTGKYANALIANLHFGIKGKKTMSMQDARAAVRMAIKKGKLKKLSRTVRCVDCDKTAQVYDHRDYSKPLDVEPVCRSCNRKRGSGKHRGEKEHFVVRMTSEMRRQLESYCEANDISLSHLVRQSLKIFLEPKRNDA